MYRLSRAGLRAVSLAASAPTRCQTVARPFSSFIARPSQHPRPSIFALTRVRTFATDDQPAASETLEDLDDNLKEPEAAAPAPESSTAPPSGVEASSSIYVGNLFFETSEQTLRDEFGRYGEISRIAVPLNDRGLPRGIAYITYSEIDHAHAAIEGMNRTVIDGRQLAVQFARRRIRGENLRDSEGRGMSPPSRTLFIGNLAHEMNDADLNDLFRDLKNVLDVRVAIDRRTGTPRGFAHADFTDEPSATAAREQLAGREFYNRTVFVDYGKSFDRNSPRMGRPSS